MSKSFDPESIRKLAEILVDTGLSEIEYEKDGERIYVARQITQHVSVPSSLPFAPPPPPQETVAPTTLSKGTIRSPMVGTAYLSPEPGASSFIKVGDQVKTGQTLLIVEAMKVMNQIKATQAGIVKSILVHDAKPVEYDEPLVVIE